MSACCRLQQEVVGRNRDWQSLLDEEVSKADRARDKLAPTEEKLAAAEGEVGLMQWTR